MTVNESSSQLKRTILSGWGLLFQMRLSVQARILIGVFIGSLGLGSNYVISHHYGFYLSEITLVSIFLISLFSDLFISLIAIFSLSLLADYFFILPVGTVLDTQPAQEHFLMVSIFGILICFLVESLKLFFQQTLKNMIKLEQLKSEAQASALTMERVLALVFHDIRTPLASSRLAAELILRKSERHEIFAQKIISGLSRADAMIQSLLDVTRMRAGEVIPLKFERCDLSLKLVETIEDLNSIYENRFQIASMPSLMGIWCPEGLQRALENLATNAVKYGSANTPVLIKIEKADQWVQISVHNEGPEISPFEQTKLFESFHRSDSAKRGVAQGWGLGLSLVKGIATAHSGEIKVVSGVGLGTTFILEIPIKHEIMGNA
ncbi:MAG: HAMP domain-containing histidine kinase [Bdellovibrionales bacterium]|nr:HAMP domain-containing histidine kinase [Oligoflexia bacterium]